MLRPCSCNNYSPLLRLEQNNVGPKVRSSCRTVYDAKFCHNCAFVNLEQDKVLDETDFELLQEPNEIEWVDLDDFDPLDSILLGEGEHELCQIPTISNQAMRTWKKAVFSSRERPGLSVLQMSWIRTWTNIRLALTELASMITNTIQSIRIHDVMVRLDLGRMFSEPNPFELLRDRAECVFYMYLELCIVSVN
jgi:hypothetical protein